MTVVRELIELKLRVQLWNRERIYHNKSDKFRGLKIQFRD